MLKLIPNVKNIEYTKGYLNSNRILPFSGQVDDRIKIQLKKLPNGENGIPLEILIGKGCLEGYRLEINEDKICIEAESEKGVFYAVQTLRQIFEQSNDKIPCVIIQDEPDFSHRGFYHDITRGKIPTLSTLKNLVDTLAYYKYNSLQLYVEHVFEFKETQNIIKRTGCITKEELIELDEYCKQNYIDFIPSLSTFGHMYEILEQDEYRHLNVLSNYQPLSNKWSARQMHHTIDPRNPQSIELVKSLIDQYIDCFTSKYFNICCDETFDLKKECGEEEKELYIDFVKKIISHVKSKGKTVMMWADILLAYPETITQLPEDVVFLNWDYRPEPELENVEKLNDLGRTQIVCPGTWSWNNFCENILDGEPNICKMAEYGSANNADGMIVTNWGDYNNICSLELSYFGLVLGAEKSWNPNALINQNFYQTVDSVLYKFDGACKYVRELVEIQEGVSWTDICYMQYQLSIGETYDKRADLNDLVIKEKLVKAKDFIQRLSKENWEEKGIKEQLIIACKGIIMLILTNAKLAGKKVDFEFDLFAWLKDYSNDWLIKNKPSELYRIEQFVKDVFEG